MQHSRHAPLFGNAIAALRNRRTASYSCVKGRICMAADAQNPGARSPGSDRSEGASPATDQARLQELSRKLLDLWQDHLSAVAQDPNLLAQALKLMTAAPFAWMPGFSPEGGPGFAQSPNPFQPGPFQPGPFQPGPFQPGPFQPGPFQPGPFQPGIFDGPFAPAAKAGTAPAAAASAAGADDVEQLRRRLAELEGRLAQLEGGAAKPGTGSKPGKARSGVGKPRRRAAKS